MSSFRRDGHLATADYDFRRATGEYAYCHNGLHFNNLPACEEALTNARALPSALENAAVNYYWGLFQERKRNDKEALLAIQRASELGFQHHGLPMKIDDLERAIERTL